MVGRRRRVDEPAPTDAQLPGRVRPHWDAPRTHTPRAAHGPRLLLLTSRSPPDGTFWIGFEDFCIHFTDVTFVRRADDRWSRAVVRSRWQDESAGGAPQYCSWRHNYQWLLTIKRETRLTIQLSVPDSRHTSGAADAYTQPIGFALLRGNDGDAAMQARARRRRAAAAPALRRRPPSHPSSLPPLRRGGSSSSTTATSSTATSPGSRGASRKNSRWRQWTCRTCCFRTALRRAPSRSSL